MEAAKNINIAVESEGLNVNKELQMPIKPGKYIHFKGSKYEVIGIATHSESLEEMVRDCLKLNLTAMR